jgi:tRNA threonylcarbamoyladenosine biosynthesis protein TsaE
MIGEHYSDSSNATEALAAQFAKALKPGSSLALIGELGAGKTCFVRGLARGLGVPPEVPVTSPTFTVMNTYVEGQLPLYHFDLYRLADFDELEAVGFREFVGGNGIAVIEWADRIPDAMPPRHWRIVIIDGAADNERIITIKAVG